MEKTVEYAGTVPKTEFERKQTFAIRQIMCYTKTKAKNLGKRESVPCSARCNRWA